MTSQPLFEARKLSKSYGTADSRINALKSVDLSIGEGEFLAITGPSGSGKSTLLGLLGLLARPSAGQLLFHGDDVTRVRQTTAAALRNSQIGFVFQSFQLLDRHTALENVAMPLLYANVGPRLRRERALRALEQVGLATRASHYPAQLSGGEQQRVAIARALINSPSVILADEPTGALDSKTGTDIMTLLQDLNRAGRCIVIITHNMDIAVAAHRHVTLVDGVLGHLAHDGVSTSDAAP